jgi:Flp pilus assembly protein TadG
MMNDKNIGTKIKGLTRSALDAASDRAGTAAVEFALVLPMLLVMLVGIIQFGVAINNYLELTDAVRAGARSVAVSRSSATSATPLTTMTSAISASAANLTSANITTTLSVNGTACTSDSTCATAIAAAEGDAATVTSTYPCISSAFVFYVQYFATSCKLTSTTAELIE